MFAATDLQDEVRCLPLQDLMDLWDKAINTPDNLTVEDRQQILGRVQPEADNQCKARCGLTLDALVLKAARQPDDLADDETKIIIWGPRSFGPGDSEEIKRRLRWPRELHERRRAATEAAETETECQARKNAWQVHLRISSQRRTVLERLRSDDERNIACCDQLEWVDKLDSRPNDSWGFVASVAPLEMMLRGKFSKNKSPKPSRRRYGLWKIRISSGRDGRSSGLRMNRCTTMLRSTNSASMIQHTYYLCSHIHTCITFIHSH